MNRDTIILIGPARSGKSTVGAIVAEKLGIPNISLDAVGYEFGKEIYIPGDSKIVSDHLERHEFMEFFHCSRRYEFHAVKRTLETYDNCVIDFGAGHSVYDDPEQFEKIKNILGNYAFVFLLLPCEDPEEALAVMNSRTDFPLHLATNEFLLNHPSNYILADYTVYTDGCTPEETAETIIEIFKANNGRQDH